MRKVLFVFLSLFLFLSIPAHASIVCASTSEAVAENNACSQLGETRMLSDGSGLIACVVKDPTQTGSQKDCVWTGMTKSGGSSGSTCGHVTYTFKSTSIKTSKSGHDDYSYSCVYAKNPVIQGDIECEGQNIVSSYSMTASATSPAGYEVVGYVLGAGYLHVKPNCPSGYSLKHWGSPPASNGSASSTPYYLPCTSGAYENVCVKD